MQDRKNTFLLDIVVMCNILNLKRGNYAKRKKDIYMIAIQTKYLGATNTKPSRIKAFTCNGHSCIISYDYALSDAKLHFKAVKALVSKCKLDWDISKMNYGGVKDGYVFTFPSSVVS